MNPVAIIFDNFGPYHLARLGAAAGVCDLLAIEVAGRSAVYAWDNDPAAGGFRRITLVEQGTSDAVRGGEIARRLEAALEKFCPAAVVVPGWASPAAWAAMRWCARRGVAMIGMSESTAWDEPRAGWKEAVKRRLVGLYSAALVGGSRHADYLVQLGFPRERIFFGYDAVDNGYFIAETDKVRADGDPVRARLRLPERYFLASARFVEKKNLPRLLEAYARYRALSAEAGCTPWALVLLGDGEGRAELERAREALGLREDVRLPGFRQYGDLPLYYALAGAFIHASTIEPWGLVVNEAAASGLPLLVSDRCGCAPELVGDGENGFTFAPENVEDLARKMAQLAAPDFPRKAFAAASRARVAAWGPERFGRGVAEGLPAVLAGKPAPVGALDRALLHLLLRR